MFEAFVAYLIGSIPFGLLLSNVFGDGSLRSRGSGNIGATNVLRTQGKLMGGVTFALDAAKGVIPILLMPGADPIYLFCAAVIGHMFPVWLAFNGGKGVSTFLGALAAVLPILAVLTIAVWILVFKLYKTSSISSLVAVLFADIAFGFTCFISNVYGLYDFIFFTVVVVIIFARHRSNIMRLIAGNENKTDAH